MIIIQEYAEKALTERLETIKQEAKHSRCVTLKFSSTPITASSAIPTIQQYLETNVETTEQYQLFICEDGDAYLLGNNIASKDIQMFLMYLEKTLNIDIRSMATLYELPAQIYPVLTSVDEKIQRKANIKNTAMSAIEQSKQQQKRHSILSVVNEEHAKSAIIKQRKERTRPQIMVIEDDSFTRQLVINLLQKQYAIAGTGTSSEALKMYVRLAPDILFLDINLPDISGHQFLERIIELDPNAYIIMLSGNADRENIVHAISKGAKGFVGKPFTKDKLLQYIEKRLSTS